MESANYNFTDPNDAVPVHLVLTSAIWGLSAFLVPHIDCPARFRVSDTQARNYLKPLGCKPS